MQGAENMKKEIWKRGPIGCGVDATEKFDKYMGGVFRQKLKHPGINHEISVVGWGRDQETGEEYWVGRNSWGTYWVGFVSHLNTGRSRIVIKQIIKTCCKVKTHRAFGTIWQLYGVAF